MIDVQLIETYFLVFAYIFMTTALFERDLGIYSAGILGSICSFVIIIIFHFS